MEISKENQIWLNWIKINQNLRLMIEIGCANRILVRLIIIEKGWPKTIVKKGPYSLDLLISKVKEEFAMYNLSKKIFPNQV